MPKPETFPVPDPEDQDTDKPLRFNATQMPHGDTIDPLGIHPAPYDSQEDLE